MAAAIVLAAATIALCTSSPTSASKKAEVNHAAGSLQTNLQATAGIASAANFKHHVLFITIDGLRNVDLNDPVVQQYIPNILSLASNGVRYNNGFTAIPSDSFPGELQNFTSASPKTMGVYYDVSYSRTAVSSGTNGMPPVGTIGTIIQNDQSIDKAQDFATTGNPNLFQPHVLPITDANLSIDPTLLPYQPGTTTPLYPHNYLKTNTIFEVAHGAGFRTAWIDKHAAYEIVRGPSGLGLDDLYTPEIDAFVTVNPDGSLTNNYNGISPKLNITAGLAYDDLKLNALLNQINGKTSQGTAVANNQVPGIYGMNFLAVSSFQKTVTGGIDYVTGTNGPTMVNPDLVTALQHTDASIGKIIAQLKANDLYDNTMIVLSSKHGQAPRIGKSAALPGGTYAGILAAQNPSIVVNQSTEDNISLLWLADQTKTNAAVQALVTASANPTNVISAIYANTTVVAPNVFSMAQGGFGNPATEDRTPDIIVKTTYGTLIGKITKKRAEHGGFSDDETHTAMIVSGGIPTNVRGTTQTTVVSNRQLAPLMLQYLGLDMTLLQGA